ncbi:MAG TPA: ABC transporter permease, partial [Kribbella sp.]
MTTLTLPVTTAPAVHPSRNLLRDIRIVMTRELKPVLRDPFSLLFGMIQPLVFLALFGPLLSGSMGGTFGDGVWQWFVPSILVMTTLFGTSTTGANLLFEFQTGAHERMLVTPLSRSSLLIGRALKEMVPLFGQAVIVIAVMTPFAFDLHLGGAVVGM